MGRIGLEFRRIFGRQGLFSDVGSASWANREGRRMDVAADRTMVQRFQEVSFLARFQLLNSAVSVKILFLTDKSLIDQFPYYSYQFLGIYMVFGQEILVLDTPE